MHRLAGDRIIAGGVIGGFAHQRGGDAAVFVITAAMARIRLIVASSMAQSSYLKTLTNAFLKADWCGVAACNLK